MIVWGRGYNVPDELFQIIEPAWGMISGYWYKTWEWERGLRSWVAPGIVAGLFKASMGMGWNDPESMMRVVRLFCALASLSLPLWMYRSLRIFVGSRWAGWSALLFSLWPAMIYFSVRSMGEMLAADAFYGVLLILGPTLYEAHSAPSSKASFRKFFFAGLLLGLSFSIRFQMALLILGLFAIYAFRRQWKILLPFAGGAALWLLFQGVLDSYTWGNFLHSPIQYLLFNGIEGGAAEHFGADPWHRYLSLLNRWFSLPGVLVVLVGLFFAFKNLKKVLKAKEFGNPVLVNSCLLFIFVIPHVLSAHKEDRFLLPIFPLLFFVVCLGLHSLIQKLEVMQISLGKRRALFGLMALFILGAWTNRLVRMPWMNNLPMLEQWERQAPSLQDGMRVAYYGELPSLFYLRRDLNFVDRPYSTPETFVDRVVEREASDGSVDAWVIMREKENLAALLKEKGYVLGLQKAGGVFLRP